jgi:N-acetylmuramoyl-L-alanine amidase
MVQITLYKSSMKLPFFSSKKKVTTKISHRSRKFKRSLTKYGLASVNILLVAVVAAFLTYSNHDQRPTEQVLSNSTVIAEEDKAVVLDQISSADIAANIAMAVRLPEADQVRNQADSRSALVKIAVSDDVVVTKPQIITEDTTGSQSRQDIVEYVTVDGDTVQALAERYNVSSDSIRWSNGLGGDRLIAGQTIMIPPKNRNGIVYKVTANDSIEKLAEKFKSTQEKIIAFNDLELSNSLPLDQYIFIPDGERQPDPVVPAAPSFLFASFGSGNGYSGGYCTWHAANRRMEIGRPIPTNLGNAITWYARAQAMGLATGYEPQAGAVLYHTDIGGLGHVAFVEKINEDGSMWVSDMNYNGFVSMDTSSAASGGWGRLTYRLVSPSEFGRYRFIY